jgi:hypothetical protein
MKGNLGKQKHGRTFAKKKGSVGIVKSLSK